MNITIEQIAEIVCRYTGIPLDKVRSITRERDVVYARHLICLLAHHFTELSLNQIATFLRHPGQKMNHTTVMNAIHVLSDRISVGEQPLCEDYDRINILINNYKNDETVKVNVKEIVRRLERTPEYNIEPCRTFGELADFLNKKIT